MILPRSFFNRPTPIVAKALLGKFLVHSTPHGLIASMITDVELYDGLRDKGSHAHRGKTARNAPMFGPAGHWYIYFTYGMHWLLNIVTREAGYPATIFIRGVEGFPGPARLTKGMGITRRVNGLPASRGTGLWIEDRGIVIPRSTISKAPRIGIDYAGQFWMRRKWRFYLSLVGSNRSRMPALRRR